MQGETTALLFQRLKLRELPLVFWCALASIAAVTLGVAQSGGQLHTNLGDTDDAMRLVQVRAWLGGTGWYDMILPRFGGAEPLHSSWSRLVDVPIGLLMLAFGAFFSAPTAELLTRVVWPSFLLFAIICIVAHAAQLKGGRAAAFYALALILLGVTALVQFLPGRVDHHSVMIIGAVGGTIFLWRSFDDAKFGWAAGALLGLGITVGYEALLLSALAMALGGGLALSTGAGAAGVSRSAMSLVITLMLGLLLNVHPANWSQIHCDALSLNLALLVACCSGGLALALTVGRPRSAYFGFAIAAVAAGLGLLIFAAIDPTCLKGPTAQIYPGALDVWFWHVTELKHVFKLWQSAPALAVSYTLHVLAILAASVFVLRRDRDAATIFFVVATISMALMGFYLARLMPYASLMGVVLLAVAISRLDIARIGPPLRSQLIVLAVVNHKMLIIAVAIAIGAISTKGSSGDARASDSRSGCQSMPAIAPLAGLDRGLTVAHIDLGPFLVAGTSLDALAAPYHRLGRQIFAAHDILKAPPEEAEAKLRAVGARYVVTCPGLVGWVKYEPGKRALEQELLADRPPPYLAKVQLPASTTLTVWELVPVAK